MDMMKKCNDLRKALEQKIPNGDRFDMLGKYRSWFDKRGIDSETEEGWPKEFVFNELNIQDFINDWLGKKLEQP